MVNGHNCHRNKSLITELHFFASFWTSIGMKFCLQDSRFVNFRLDHWKNIKTTKESNFFLLHFPKEKKLPNFLKPFFFTNVKYCLEQIVPFQLRIISGLNSFENYVHVNYDTACIRIRSDSFILMQNCNYNRQFALT